MTSPPEIPADDPSQSSAFPADALQALELHSVLEWIADFAFTPGGKRLVLSSHPSLASSERKLRNARGLEALAAVHAEKAPGIAGAGDLAQVLDFADKRLLEGDELLIVADFLDIQRHLQQWLAQNPAHEALRMCMEAAPDCQPLRHKLRAAIGRRGEILDEAHPSLGSARRKVGELHKQRSQRMEEIAGRLHKAGVLRQRLPVRRADRLLLAVKATHAGRSRGVVHDRSQSGDTLFIEPSEVLELSNRMVEAESNVRRIEEQVLTKLTRAVLDNRLQLTWIESAISQLDLAFGGARWAAEVQGSFATDDVSGITLRQARHPLLLRQMGADEVEELNLGLGRDYDLLVVTGPNTGGKTVVLKTVGLLAVLALCGLPISAGDGCNVPALSGVHADIGDQQSIESSLSTFSGHLTRTLSILRHAGPRSLVLLDELGTGTDPEEGAAIGQSVLEELLRRQCLTIANTHLGALKILSTDLPRAENASMEFDPQTLSPRYRLLVGVPGASHAVEVAERLGLPLDLVERARHLTLRDGGGAEKLLADVGRVRRDAELLRESAEEMQAEARQVRDQVEQDQLDAARLAEVRQGEAEQAFIEHRRQMMALVMEQGLPLVQRSRGPIVEDWQAFLKQIGAELDQCELGRRWQEFVAGIKKGDTVYVPKFRERLKVLKIQRKREMLKLRYGNLDVELPVREVSWVEPPPGGE